MGRAHGSWTLAMPNDLPRWTVPLVMMSTLALELWDVWPTAPAAGEPLAIEACAGQCEHQGLVLGSWGPYACSCQPRPTSPGAATARTIEQRATCAGRE